MSTIEINHAVRLEADARCKGCRMHLCDLLSEEKHLIITNCQHIFDHMCYLRLRYEAVTRKELPMCKCGEAITIVEVLTPNLLGECAFKGVFPHRGDGHKCEEDYRLPASIQDSLNHRNQVMILNCGHLVHALCWIDFLFAIKKGMDAICPSCEVPYTDAMPFRVKTLKLENFTLSEAIEFEEEFVDLKKESPKGVQKIIDDFEVI